MCDPTGVSESTIIMMAISAASAAASAIEQKNMADRQTEAAQKSYDSDVMQTKNEMDQQTQQASSQMSERARQAMVETGHLQALANESGTNGGGSNDRVTNEANFNAGTDMATIQENASSAQRQLLNQLDGNYSQAVSRDASIMQPSLIGTGLQIASGVGNAYNRGAAAKARAQGGVTADGSNPYGFAMPGSTS